eukprot:gene15616-biopygen13532
MAQGHRRGRQGTLTVPLRSRAQPCAAVRSPHEGLRRSGKARKSQEEQGEKRGKARKSSARVPSRACAGQEKLGQGLGQEKLGRLGAAAALQLQCTAARGRARLRAAASGLLRTAACGCVRLRMAA